ncbi:MAG: 1-acyl-sn-glycerol-3-phosphate acyltransferase [Candidatus Rokubacteria bacterium]|nr:1-acyl-sn-glycerol-3-phosphate acyltransferase [Candidatus Rokubacteria bacterium]
MAEPAGYRIFRSLARFLAGLFYRRVEVAGLERVPLSGPLIVAANHHQGLMDGILLTAALPRRLRLIAKAPLFRYPVIGQIARLAGAIPVHRRQDSGGRAADNQAMFSAAERALGQGAAILIFPEGVSQPEPALMPLRTGAARLVLGSDWVAGLELRRLAATTLLPVGLMFHEPGTFRVGTALVLIGEPVPTGDLEAPASGAADEAVRQLTERLGGALERLIVLARDRATLELVHAAEAIWRQEMPDAAREPKDRAAWRQRAARADQYLAAAEPARLAALRGRLERYVKDLELAGLTDRDLSEGYRPAAVLRYAFREGLALALGLPLALWGVLSHVVPYQATRLAVSAIKPEADVLATYKVVAGLVLFPLCWALEGWTAWRLGGGAFLAVFLIALLPTGFFALSWTERLHRIRREARGLLTVLVDRDLRAHLLARRRAIMAEFQELLRLVPASVLEKTAK